MGLTFTGKQAIRDLLNNTSTSKISHIGWGAGSAVFADTDTALGSELFPAAGATERNPVSATRVNPSQVILTGSVADTQLNGASLFEIGAFDAVNGGTLIARQTYFIKLKTSGLKLTTDWYFDVVRV